MGFSLIYTAHLMSPLKIWQMHPQSNSFFSHFHSQNQFMSKSKLILSELKQILCLRSLSQNGKNIHPITLAGNTEISADTFFSPVPHIWLIPFSFHTFSSWYDPFSQRTLLSYHHQPSSKPSYVHFWPSPL